ncbi:YD repeat-containing protein [bacterium A37T11]|nr:YD repeat-containing protein [bacterium A37T11]
MWPEGIIYHYPCLNFLNTNKLASVSGYTYDAIGRMDRVTKGGVTLYLVYDVSGKVTKIFTYAAKTQIKYSFAYNESGQRIKKQDHTNNAVTWYVYDAGGQLMSVFDNGDGSLKLREQPLDG